MAFSTAALSRALSACALSFGMSNSTPSRALIGLILIPSIVIAALMAGLYFVAMPLAPAISEYYFSQQELTYLTYRVPLYTHIACGAVALITGAINLVSTLRRGRARAHPVIGRVYIASVTVSAVCGSFLAFHAYPGTLPGGQLIVTSGFLLLAILWLITAAIALHAIVARREARAHRFWMIVNFSLTFAAVTIRFENGILLATDTFDAIYPLLGWVSWVPNLLIGVLLARRLERRRPQAGLRSRQFSTSPPAQPQFTR